MRLCVSLVLGLLVAAVVGCGSSSSINTAPLTDEQKAQIKQDDQRLDDEERSGSGTATAAKKKKR